MFALSIALIVLCVVDMYDSGLLGDKIRIRSVKN
ncbi:hypothetical protein BMS3Bbin04_02098 [bacterium BMS3Bbin04]|nr:hypothetical protein BMS3Bbin04_02098 [bacterium BMS3Bbin04]